MEATTTENKVKVLAEDGSEYKFKKLNYEENRLVGIGKKKKYNFITTEAPQTYASQT